MIRRIGGGIAVAARRWRSPACGERPQVVRTSRAPTRASRTRRLTRARRSTATSSSGTTRFASATRRRTSTSGSALTGGSAMRRMIERAGAALLACCWLATAAAQSPAVNPKEADYAKAQAAQQQSPAAQQPAGVERGALGRAAVHERPGRETNVLIQSQGQTWRALRNGQVSVYGGWLLVARRPRDRGVLLAQGPIPVHGAPTADARSSASPPAERIVALGDGDHVRDPRDHRARHPVRQVHPAAADRLHAVLLARDPGEEPAQLRRAGVRRLHDPHVRHVRARQPSREGRPRLAREGRRHVHRASTSPRASSTPARRCGSGSAWGSSAWSSG